MIRKPFLFILLSAVLLAACGKTPLSETGLKAENSIATVRDLTSAYERRDITAFMDKVSSAYPDRAEFQRSVEKVFATYQSISLKALFNRAVITVPYRGSLKVTFTWEGEWQSTSGKVVKDGAQAILILDPGTLKLANIEGKNLFLPSEAPIPLRQ